MSKRVATTLTLFVTTPLPAGWSQTRMIAELKLLLDNTPAFNGIANQIIVKVVGKETHYL